MDWYMALYREDIMVVTNFGWYQLYVWMGVNIACIQVHALESSIMTSYWMK